MIFGTLRTDAGLVPAVISPAEQLYWPLAELLGRPVDALADVVAELHGRAAELTPGEGRPLAGLPFAAPLRPVRNVLCVGKNYRDHVKEIGALGDPGAKEDIPAAPIVFTKAPETVIGDGDTILYPHGVSDQIDYEAELGVVIGKGGRGVAPADAYRHVFGYTIINDVTARDRQSRHKQWFLGKSLDTFCPMGPWIVSADALDPADLQVRCWVNGELRQDGRTSEMIFDIPTLIQTISAGLTLIPGDVIATGTPAGVGAGMKPPRFLHPGDEVAMEISGIGRLSNRLG